MIEYKEYEIWLGQYNLGQGYGNQLAEPKKVAIMKATSFKIACYLYELENAIISIKDRMDRGDNYIEDTHFGISYYNPRTNSNSWTGKYFETREEALKTF